MTQLRDHTVMGITQSLCSLCLALTGITIREVLRAVQSIAVDYGARRAAETGRGS